MDQNINNKIQLQYQPYYQQNLTDNYAIYDNKAKVSYLELANNWKELYKNSQLGRKILTIKQITELRTRNLYRAVTNISENYLTKYYSEERNYAFEDSCQKQLSLTNYHLDTNQSIHDKAEQIKLAEKQIQNLQTDYIQKLHSQIEDLNCKNIECPQPDLQMSQLNYFTNHLKTVNKHSHLSPLLSQIQQYDQQNNTTIIGNLL